ncbi:BHLF1 early reading frame [human gammaherpesvirus 4]|nr:BHLF1 early reading frame [human gammaherpesvirus 4]
MGTPCQSARGPRTTPLPYCPPPLPSRCTGPADPAATPRVGPADRTHPGRTSGCSIPG